MGPRANDRSESPSAALQILQTELVELVELALQIQQMKWTLVPEVPASRCMSAPSMPGWVSPVLASP